MPPSPDSKEITVPIVRFLNEIGIAAHSGEVPDDTFVPGIEVRGGTLIFDEAKMKYPGDLLHEAGHLAVMLPEKRVKANATVDTGPGEEMAVIAWSYAAALHLGIDPAIVFHPEGYKGGSLSILENFSQGRYFGVSLLQWWGMTAEKKNAARSDLAPYPQMTKWSRD
jgi:hypothetical protein